MAVKDKLVNLEDLKVVNDDLQGKCSDLNSAIKPVEDKNRVWTGSINVVSGQTHLATDDQIELALATGDSIEFTFNMSTASISHIAINLFYANEVVSVVDRYDNSSFVYECTAQVDAIGIAYSKNNIVTPGSLVCTVEALPVEDTTFWEKSFTVVSGKTHQPTSDLLRIDAKAETRVLISFSGSDAALSSFNIRLYHEGNLVQTIGRMNLNNVVFVCDQDVDAVGIEYGKNYITTAGTLHFSAQLLEGTLVAYVSSSTGDDNNNGKKSTPLKTIAMALNLGAKSIFVERGTYNEIIGISGEINISIQPWEFPQYASGTSLLPISVSSVSIQNSSGIVLREIKSTPTGNSPAFYANNVNGLRCESCEANGSDTNGFELINVSGEFIGCVAHNVGGSSYPNSDGFNIHGYGYTSFINCIAYSCYDDGISHHDDTLGLIQGGEFYNNGHGGLNAGICPYGNAKIAIENVYCHNNTKGIEVSANTMIKNSILNANDVDLVVDDGYTATIYGTKYTTSSIAETGTLVDLTLFTT